MLTITTSTNNGIGLSGYYLGLTYNKLVMGFNSTANNLLFVVCCGLIINCGLIMIMHGLTQIICISELNV